MSGLFAKILGMETREDGGDYQVVVDAMAVNRESASGFITPTSAMKISAVFACVRILAETLGSLPLILYERVAEGKRRAQNHYLYNVLHDRPNELMTAFEFREAIQGHLALWGNAYIQTEYDARGRITELWPLLPSMMHLTKRDGYMRYYYYQLPNGQMKWLSSNVIWHLRGLGGDGLNGYSVIGFARTNWETSLSADAYVNRFYKNDARPGIVLEYPGVMSDEAHKKLKKSWKEEHEGVNKAHRVAILEEGMKLHEVGIPPEDAQFIETRDFQVLDICRWFRVQPHKVMQLKNATFSNIEHQSIEHVTDTITPWARRWEQSINQNLLLQGERDRYYAEFLLEALLRGDTATRYQAYATARQNGWLSANDIRELENMNPVEGGDIYLVPLNMVPAPQAGQQQETNSTRGEVRSVENRSASMRLRLRGAWLQIYRDTAQRVLRRESNDIKRQVQKMTRQMDTAKLLLWLDEFYREHFDFVKRSMAPVAGSYGEAIVAEALDEIGEDFEISPEVLRFIDSYNGSYSARHIGISQDRIRQAISQAQQEQIPPEESIERELDTWQEGRAYTIAEEESTRFNNAVAKTVFALAGIQKLRSNAFGESCPYCRALDGKVVGIKQHFLTVGDQLQPDGVEEPLTTTSNIGHPPYHAGCDCMITAEISL
jgi:HK97 family phage portal protein